MMAEPIECRVQKLARLSSHYRDLAHGFLSPEVNAEIEAVADEYAKEAARLKRECADKDDCPHKRNVDCCSCTVPSLH